MFPQGCILFDRGVHFYTNVNRGKVQPPKIHIETNYLVHDSLQQPIWSWDFVYSSSMASRIDNFRISDIFAKETPWRSRWPDKLPSHYIYAPDWLPTWWLLLQPCAYAYAYINLFFVIIWFWCDGKQAYFFFCSFNRTPFFRSVLCVHKEDAGTLVTQGLSLASNSLGPNYRNIAANGKIYSL